MPHILKVLGVILISLPVAISANAQSIEEFIASAVLPLPEDLRAQASVFYYDEAGERVVLRQGSNQVECIPKNSAGFTWCYPVQDGPRRDLREKLRVDGVEGEAFQTALNAAHAEGRIQPRTFGSLVYRLYDKDESIQLLWFVMVPNATAYELGISSKHQVPDSIEGRGMPWIMYEGTPDAHLMLPINGTELSSKPE